MRGSANTILQFWADSLLESHYLMTAAIMGSTHVN